MDGTRTRVLYGSRKEIHETIRICPDALRAEEPGSPRRKGELSFPASPADTIREGVQNLPEVRRKYAPGSPKI